MKNVLLAGSPKLGLTNEKKRKLLDQKEDWPAFGVLYIINNPVTY